MSLRFVTTVEIFCKVWLKASSSKFGTPFATKFFNASVNSEIALIESVMDVIDSVVVLGMETTGKGKYFCNVSRIERIDLMFSSNFVPSKFLIF